MSTQELKADLMTYLNNQCSKERMLRFAMRPVISSADKVDADAFVSKVKDIGGTWACEAANKCLNIGLDTKETLSVLNLSKFFSEESPYPMEDYFGVIFRFKSMEKGVKHE